MSEGYEPPKEGCFNIKDNGERHICWLKPGHEGEHRCYRHQCDVTWTDIEGRALFPKGEANA